MKVSGHGKKRVRERLGLNKKAINRQFELALTRGYRQHELKGNLKKWVVAEVFATGVPKECIIYNNYCFIVGKGDVLVTVIPIPGNLLKEVKYLKKKD